MARVIFHAGHSLDCPLRKRRTPIAVHPLWTPAPAILIYSVK